MEAPPNSEVLVEEAKPLALVETVRAGDSRPSSGGLGWAGAELVSVVGLFPNKDIPGESNLTAEVLMVLPPGNEGPVPGSVPFTFPKGLETGARSTLVGVTRGSWRTAGFSSTKVRIGASCG